MSLDAKGEVSKRPPPFEEDDIAPPVTARVLFSNAWKQCVLLFKASCTPPSFEVRGFVNRVPNSPCVHLSKVSMHLSGRPPKDLPLFFEATIACVKLSVQDGMRKHGLTFHFAVLNLTSNWRQRTAKDPWGSSQSDSGSGSSCCC